jgi:protein-arginine deiminase
VVNGVDVLAQDMFDRLGTDKLGLGSDGKGMKVHLIDDWYGYHLLMGEVHCGTNPDAPPNPAWKWWTVAH